MQKQFIILLGFMGTCGCDGQSVPTKDDSPWPTRLESFSYCYQPKLLGSATSLGMNSNGDIYYSFSSKPYTDSGGHTVVKEWHIPKEEAEKFLDSLVNDGLLDLGMDGFTKFPVHQFTVSSKGWQKVIRPIRLPDVIWKRLLSLLIHAHPEMWHENTPSSEPAGAEKPDH
ncbi:MAG: hypothetical protein HZA50_09870 [Planctomycetes bacterium]|nr:hypothetical protein [Planctomycetota bacterium]